MGCLKDCTQLQELALDGNPIYGKKGYVEFCLNNCANLKQLDMRKVTPEMRSDPNSVKVDEKVDKNDLNTIGNESTATAT